MGQLQSRCESMYGSPVEGETSDSERDSGSSIYGSGEIHGSGSETSPRASEIDEEEEKPIIMVLGGPGSGKGTQCGRMVQEFGFKHISLGDILREEVKQGTPVGKECSRIMKEGRLVPVNLTLDLMKKAMTESKDATGYILDGFPRATSQAQAFQREMKAPTLVLYLHAPQNVLLQRLLSRGESSGRADDNAETILKRFDTFKKESLPVVSYYEKNSPSVVKKVCTIKPPDDVYKQIQSAVKKAISSTTQLRRHIRRRVVHNKEAEESHVKRVKRRKKKKQGINECTGHPYVPPAEPRSKSECILM